MRTYSVTECSHLLSDTLKKNYLTRSITVRGLVSGLHTHWSGISFFSLVEGRNKIACFIGRAHHTFLMRNLMSGMEASVVGDLRYNEVRGYPVLMVERVLKVTESAEKQAQDALVEKLTGQGYFDPGGKKPLPRFPFLIGIITSGTGAVIHDILKTGALRNPAVGYRLFNSAVQGEGAAEAMAESIRQAAEAVPRPDILILARGGGAEEDLTPFNEPVLLSAIHQCPIPVISAVGHETDVTLADRVADARASTPTQAAELAVPLLSTMEDAVKRELSFLRYACLTAVSDGRSMVKGELRSIQYEAPAISRRRGEVLASYTGLKDGVNDALLAAYHQTGNALVSLMEERIDGT